MHFEKAQRYILKRLDQELPRNLYYHGLHHTLDVADAVERLAKLEKVSKEEVILLKTAALYHDAGFIKKYFMNEEIAAKMAKESLPYFGYTSKQIKTISEIIMATRISVKPVNHLEEIIRDADLDYLGREDFYPIANTLRKELYEYGLKYSGDQWKKILVDFLGTHKYYTKSAKKLRESKKQKYLAQVKKLKSVTEETMKKLHKKLISG